MVPGIKLQNRLYANLSVLIALKIMSRRHVPQLKVLDLQRTAITGDKGHCDDAE